MTWYESACKFLAKWKQEEELKKAYTPRAVKALALAGKEAGRLNHNYVGTEHILLGLVRLGKGVATNVLKALGLNLDSVREEVEKHAGGRSDQKLFGPVPYTPRTKKVLETARNQANVLNHAYVGTGHLLLGLLSEGDGLAARVLKHFNVDFETTRKEILKQHEPILPLSDDEGTG